MIIGYYIRQGQNKKAHNSNMKPKCVGLYIGEVKYFSNKNNTFYELNEVCLTIKQITCIRYIN